MADLLLQETVAGITLQLLCSNDSNNPRTDFRLGTQDLSNFSVTGM